MVKESARIYAVVVCGVMTLVLAVSVAAGAPATKPGVLRLAIVQFLSGAGAPHDESAVNAGKLLVDEINAAGGIGGAKIELIVADEAGSVAEQVAQFRRLVQDQKVDVVIGYTSSSNCLAVAPVAEQLRTLYISAICANYRLFEERRYRYVFRTSAHAVSENVAAARYVLAIKPDVRTIAGLNYDYAYGRDSWEIFKRAMLKLKPDVKVVAELWPRFLATEYSAEISQLLALGPDVIHTVNWGAGLTALIKQGQARGLFDRSLVMITTGLLEQAELLPPGVGFTGRGYHLQYPDPRERNRNREFLESYRRRYGKLPDYTGHFMAQAIFGLKAGFEKALRRKGAWPTIEEVAAALEGLTFETPRGPVRVREDHQAVHGAMWGLTSGKKDPVWGYPVLTRFRIFQGEEVNPPVGVRTLDWIASWPERR